jgi:hypothetical protein
MTAQTISDGICKVTDTNCRKVYSVPCVCGCNEHTMTMEISREHRDDEELSLTIYSILKTDWRKNRFKHIWTLLTKGYIELETDTLISNQAAENMATAILNDFLKGKKK